MKPVALLDVNVLVALFFAAHAQHDVAHDWFEDHRKGGWATCAVTENGAVRILSNRSLVMTPWSPSETITQLRRVREAGGHQFLPMHVSLTDERIFDPAIIRGHRQVTDIYLLGLATAAGGTFVTFDRSIPLAAVKGATDQNLTVLSAAPEESTSAGT